MRKLIIYIVLIVLCYSCNDENDDSVITSDGIIVETTGSIYQYGTHTLKSESGETLYALTSSSINLYDYNDFNVELKGRLIEGYPVEGGPEFLEVKSIKVK